MAKNHKDTELVTVAHLVVVRLAAGRGSRRHFLLLLLLLLSLWLLGDGCHGSGGRVAGHEDELRGDGGPEGAVDLQDGRTAIKHTETKLPTPVSSII